MKVVLSSYRNPHFITITEYIEKALKGVGSQTSFFNNRDFIFPGRAREILPYLARWDLKRINKRLLSLVRSFRPHLFLEVGGHRISPGSIDEIKGMGVKTALWTADAPLDFEPVIEGANHYDYVFTSGSEAYDILREAGVKNLRWLPFACDPEVHRPLDLTEEEKRLYSCDVAFVGTIDPELYPFRVKTLEAISALNLGIWGPGVEKIPEDSPIKRHIRGGKTTPDIWTKIYSASKIVLCMHYKDPEGKTPCHQASPRVYEAMACGAFLVVDNQRDVKRLFTPGEDLVVFKDEDGLKEIVAYYLYHPEEARVIARRGREKVLREHTYRHRIEEILKIVGLA